MTRPPQPPPGPQPPLVQPPDAETPALAWALAFARIGWPVFPCHPGTKTPATRHGFKDATTDPGQIRAWWNRNPAANLAIATGAPGPDVLDIDQHGPAGNGYPAYRKLQHAGLTDGAFAIIATPGGGLHAYFPGTGQPTHRLPRCHIDFRAADGCVLTPPSRIGGKPYRLLALRDPGTATLNWQAVTTLLAPPQLAPRQTTAPRPHPAAPGNISSLAAWVARLPEGNRNSGLYWAACRAIDTGHSCQLDDLAAAATAAGLPHREITATIASARRHRQARPDPAPEPEPEPEPEPTI
jgi:hypothetical protein